MQQKESEEEEEPVDFSICPPPPLLYTTRSVSEPAHAFLSISSAVVLRHRPLSPPSPLSKHSPFPPLWGSVSGRRWKEKEGKGRTDRGAPSPPPSSGRSPVIRQRTLLLHLASPPPAHVPPSSVSVAPPSLPRRCCVFSSHVHTGGKGVATMLHMAACV